MEKKKKNQRGGKGEWRGNGKSGYKAASLCLPFYIPIIRTYASAASLGSSHSWPSHF